MLVMDWLEIHRLLFFSAFDSFFFLHPCSMETQTKCLLRAKSHKKHLRRELQRVKNIWEPLWSLCSTVSHRRSQFSDSSETWGSLGF